MTATQDVKTVVAPPTEKITVTKETFVRGVVLYAIGDPGGGYWACAPQLPGVVSQGDSAEEALSNVEDALMEAVQTYRDDSEEIPWGPLMVPAEFELAKPECRATRCAIVDMR